MSNHYFTVRQPLNEQSRDDAINHREMWSEHEVKILLLWDHTDDELTVLAGLLGRTREACRTEYSIAYRRAITGPEIRRRHPQSPRWNTSQWRDCPEFEAAWYK